ncbi:MAG: MBL fold metallo-hydrolase [Planctomycetota bacterium]
MDSLDRRDFLGLTLAAGAAAALPAPLALARPRRRSSLEGTFFDASPLGGSGNASAILGEGGNSLLLKSGDASLLVDSKLGPFGRVLLDDIRKLGAGRDLTVLNTHHHGDHTGGNHAFKDAALVRAHENAFPKFEASMDWYRSMGEQAVRQLDQMPADKRGLAEPAIMDYAERLADLAAGDFLPDTPITEPETIIDIGGLTVMLYAYGPGHTDNDVVVSIPELNIIHTGDLVFNGWNPFMDANGGCDPRNWVGVLENVEKLCDADTIVVPGHGEIGDVSIIRGQIAYIQRIFQEVGRSIGQEQTREQVTETTYAFQHGLGGEWIRPIANGFIYDLLQE